MTKRRITVYLIQRKRRMKSGAVEYFLLRWRGPDGKERTESLGRCSELSKAEAKAARARQEEEVNAGRVPSKREGMTLGAFRQFYRENRARGDAPKTRRTSKRYAKLSDKSIAVHDMVIRYVIEFFGEGFRLHDIDELAAERWHAALADGKLCGARTGGWYGDQLLSENSLRSQVRSVKAVFGWARTYGIIQRNPFAEFTGAGLAVAPDPYVSLEDFRAVCEHAPLPLRAMFALCRLAGLRRDEARSLPWSGSAVDDNGAPWDVGILWERKRLAVVGKGGRYRAAPIVPELMTILLEAYDEVPEGAENRVVYPVAGNLIRKLHQCIDAAGVERWRKPYQSLRSSCENDYKTAGIAEPTYLAWQGHSQEVSRKYYVSPTDAEFDAVTGGAA